jgi:formate hydrogenlyase subunit 6/NADH:ubiquinone oxidoreductase subunit I
MSTDTIQSREKLPAVDPKKCNKCGRCIDACPSRAIAESSNYSCAKCIKYCMTMEVPCNPEYMVFDYEKCDTCGLCVTACPHEALFWVVPGSGR